MISNKKLKYFIIFLVIFFSGAKLAHASLEITEIMYSPENGSDYEWVEIYNNGSTDIDLNKYRFFHGETTSGPITLKIGESAILQPSKYAIIAKSLTDYSWLDFSDMVFSSSVLSLPDSGDNTYIAISDADKTIIDSVTYDISKGGSKISKSSLSKIDGEWKSGIPTPGMANQSSNNSEVISDTTIISNDVVSANSNSNSNSSTSSSSITKKKPEILKITTKIISSKIVTAGVPFYYSSLTNTNRDETYATGRFVWNFGDGMVREEKGSGPFEYVYEYPGEYSLTLSYYDNYFSKQSNVTDKIIIKVVPSDINISSVGNNTDSFVELENKSNNEVTISNWVITAGIHNFVLPEGMTLLPGKKIKLSPKITGFSSEDIQSVSIMNISKEIIAKYPIEIKKLIPKNKTFNKSTNTNLNASNNLKVDSLFKDSQVINLNDLAASAAGTETKIPSSTYAIVGLIIIIGIGIVSFLLMKRKDNVSDYVEREIRPEDMTIIE